MPLYQATITPKTAFKTPIKGDSLFGYACWEYMHLYTQQALNELLHDYMQKPPFVLSDAFPIGTLPRPNIPLHMLGIQGNDPNIKQKKKMAYCDINSVSHPVQTWMSDYIPDMDNDIIIKHTHAHNSINRQTFSTDDSGNFAPYNHKVVFLQGDWHIYISIPDTTVITIDTVQKLLQNIGMIGYGGGKTRGLGKFDVKNITQQYSPKIHPNANAYITLAPHMANIGDNMNRCYYKTFTRFGKMGDTGALSQNPFKSPILMINTGAIITPQKFNTTTEYIGQAIGGIDTNGNGKLSEFIPHAVHQGYTPIIPVYMQPIQQGI